MTAWWCLTSMMHLTLLLASFKYQRATFSAAVWWVSSQNLRLWCSFFKPVTLLEARSIGRLQQIISWKDKPSDLGGGIWEPWDKVVQKGGSFLPPTQRECVKLQELLLLDGYAFKKASWHILVGPSNV